MAMLNGISTAELQRHLDARKRVIESLQRERSKLLSQAADIDRQIREANGPTTVRERPSKRRSLQVILLKSLQGRVMSVNEAMIAARREGYKTSSPYFRTRVSQQLSDPYLFRRVSRGMYTAA